MIPCALRISAQQVSNFLRDVMYVTLETNLYELAVQIGMFGVSAWGHDYYKKG
jgi:hypothetical protein